MRALLVVAYAARAAGAPRDIKSDPLLAGLRSEQVKEGIFVPPAHELKKKKAAVAARHKQDVTHDHGPNPAHTPDGVERFKHIHLSDDDDEHTAIRKGRHVAKPKPPPKPKPSPPRIMDHKEHRRRRKAQKKYFRHHRHFFRHAMRAVFKDLPQPIQDHPWISLASAIGSMVALLAWIRHVIIEAEENNRVKTVKKHDFNRWNPRPCGATPSWSAAALPPSIKKCAQRGEAPPILQWLPENKPDAGDAAGRTVLHHAAMHGHADLCRELVAGGCSPDAGDTEGDCPLHVAARAGSAAAVRALLDAGADVTRENAAGETPSQLALARGNHGCARLIQRREREMSAGVSGGAGDLRSRGRVADGV